jgi:GntR family transcriptional regulator of arabinose operon
MPKARSSSRSNYPINAGAAKPAQFRGQLRSEQFRDHLLAEFSRMSVGAKISSERELARDSGLSLLTVNKVLATLVAQGLVERRRGQGSFVAERKRAPVADPSNLKILRFIAREPERVLRPGNRNYISNFYKGVQDAAACDGYEVMPTPFEIAPDGTEALPEKTFQSSSIAGAFFVETGAPDYRRLWRFLEENRRIVAFDFTAPEHGLSSVVFDNAGGIREATEHCLTHGHTRLAYVAPAGMVGQPGDERLNGFRQALADAGLDHKKATVIQAVYNESIPLIQKLLTQPASSRPTAFVGFSDDHARLAITAAHNCGLRKPGVVSVVGFGGTIDGAEAIDSVEFDEVEMGRTAYTLWKSNAKGLVRRISGRLVVRGSVTSPA